MENNNRQTEKTINHTFMLQGRRRAAITGVSDVCSFDETEIVLKIDTGLMYLTGERLHIGKLLLDDGRLDVDGQIDSVIYETPRTVSKKLFAWRKKK